jgi:hypothetical protein
MDNSVGNRIASDIFNLATSIPEFVKPQLDPTRPGVVGMNQTIEFQARFQGWPKYYMHSGP